MKRSASFSPVIAVVGAGPGIGEAVAREFISHGFTAALLARTETKLQTMVRALESDFHPGCARYFIADLRQESSVRSAFASIKSNLGAPSVLVYNAGARRVNGRSILDTGADEFENFTRINLHGAFWSLQCVLPDMLTAKRGTVIFTGATGSLRGSAGLSSFAPGKFGLRALCQVVTREYQEQGIHAAHIIVDTPVDGVLIGGVHKRRWERDGDNEKLKDVEGYLSQPRDIASIYWFLHTQPKSAWTHELDVRAQHVSMFSKL